MVKMLQPTSRTLLYLVIIFAVICFAVAVWTYHKGKGIKFFCAAILSGTLFTGAIALQINTTRGYIHSWAEIPALIGAQRPQTISLDRVEISADSERKQDDSAENLAKYKLNFTPVTDPKLIGDGFTGEYLQAKFSGPVSHVEQPVRVWLPNHWREMEHLKVVIFLHGFPSNPPYTQVALGVGKQLGAQIARGEVEPTIIVFPEIRPDDQEPDCVDVQGRPRIGSFVIDDVREMVKANFPVSADRADWAISGNSAGAYCAGLLGGLYPQYFADSIILSGYDDPQLGALNQLNRADRHKFYVSNVIGNIATPLRVYNYAAGDDADARLLSERIAKLNNENVTVTNVYDPQGSHNWKSWYRAFPDAMAWFAPTTAYAAANSEQIAADHAIGGPASWATKIKIEQIEATYLLVLVCWLGVLFWHFAGRRIWLQSRISLSTARHIAQLEQSNSALASPRSNLDSTQPRFGTSPAAAADLGASNQEIPAQTQQQMVYSQQSRTKWAKWLSAFCATGISVGLLAGGYALLINQKMGTISNLSNVTAIVQLLGF